MIEIIFISLLFIPIICMAEDIRSPEFYSFMTYFWVVSLSSLGGFISFLDKLGRRKITRYRALRLLQEISVAAFTGIIVFFICEWANLSQLITAAFVAVSGHMGNRALLLIETIVQKRFKVVIEEGTSNGSKTDNQDSH